MANRYYTSQFSYSFERMCVTLRANVTNNAGTLSVVGGQGMAISKTGTGLYTIVLADPYQNLLSADIVMKSALASDIMAQIVSIDTSAAVRTIVIRTVSAGVATDIPSGDGMLIRLDLRNSSQTP